MNIKHFMATIGMNGHRPALASAKAASLTLRVQRNGFTWFAEGRLDPRVSDAIKEAISTHGMEVDAAVVSYGTPIAYRVWLQSSNHAGKRILWIMPRDKYSQTTSRHQNALRATLGHRKKFVPRQLLDIERFADVFGVDEPHDIAVSEAIAPTLAARGDRLPKVP